MKHRLSHRLAHSGSALPPHLPHSQFTLYAVMTLASLEAKRLSMVATKSPPLSAILFTWLNLAAAPSCSKQPLGFAFTFWLTC